MNEEEAKEIVDDFLLELEVLSQEFGKETIANVLIRSEPGIFDELPPHTGALNEVIAPGVAAAARAVAARAAARGAPGAGARALAIGKQAKDKIKGFLGGTGKVAAGLGLGAGGLALGSGALNLFKSLDQDINIADQEIDVRVVNPSLEKLINNTNALLQSIADTLGTSGKELDDSIDYLSATVSGDSLASVKGAQATVSPTASGIERDIARAPALKSKLEPKKKKEKED